jgi:hypothetical protein
MFLLIICLALYLTNGCAGISKNRPPTSLKIPVAQYKVKPKVNFITTFQRRDFYDHIYDENDTLKKIVENVIKENELFDRYSFEGDDAEDADYSIILHLTNHKTFNGELKPHHYAWGILWMMTFTLMPIAEEMEYVLNTSLNDRLGKTLYEYTCTNESYATQYSPLTPSGMIEKMVKEALFSIINKSGIIDSYKLELSNRDDS